jgi:hypothetical protein
MTVFGRERVTAHPRRPHRYIDGVCPCGAVEDEVRTRRNRNNRSRGSRAELAVAREYGGEKVGPLNLPEDVRGKSWRTQVKVTQRPVPAMWAKSFRGMDSHKDERTARIIIRHTRPGAGHEDFVIVRGKDWLDWFGRDD